ncbi:hypothetical protein [Methylobacterium sp. WSM2598]|uniref:hypothetical protein n=1 Tax=Methylobacterium sp. WSM2598 TaxID=398261 RepID=UPI0003999466|nr:hypothetical protein [Methylobacterium sp. WSM2598]
MASPKFRLVTRSDFDGLVCGMLLRERDLIDEIKFVHPKDMQDGIVPITSRDIITNLPYVPGCHLAFDHHASEVARAGGRTRTTSSTRPPPRRRASSTTISAGRAPSRASAPT